jgi:hypothetical protein
MNLQKVLTHISQQKLSSHMSQSHSPYSSFDVKCPHLFLVERWEGWLF